jgi:concanavalin A-like lectin/glucanase superfamily protein
VSFVVLAMCAGGTPLCAQPSGLVAAYGFNEGAGTSVGDTSGNGNTGTVSGATWTAAGRFGGALVFNGTNGVVTVPSTASLQLTTGMTLEAWVYPTVAPTGWKAIVGKNVDRYYLMASSTPNNRPAVGGTWGTGNQNTIAPAALAVNTWTHLAATFDGALVQLYVNGAQVASQGQTTALTTSTATLQIGGGQLPGRVLHGADRRGAGVQPGAERGGDPGRHEHRGRRGAGAGHYSTHGGTQLAGGRSDGIRTGASFR